MSKLINRIAPDVTLPLVGGGRMNLGELRGQIVVLNFWSAECPWSKRADVVLVYKSLGWAPQGVRVVGIASNASEPESEIRLETAARLVTYPIMLDANQMAADMYGAITTPHFFILDRHGVVRYAGALDNATYNDRRPAEFYVVRAVDTLLAGRKPDPAVTTPYGCAIVRYALPKVAPTSSFVEPEPAAPTTSFVKPEAEPAAEEPKPEELNWGGWD